MNTWFYSDPHFFHFNIIRYAKRPYSTVEEMNNDLIERYNSRVKPEDSVIFLGDMFFLRKSEDEIQKCLRVYNSLNGAKKTLIIGNHDKLHNYFPYDIRTKSLTIQINGEDVLLNHYPYRPSDRPEMNRRPLDEGKFLLHGHSHNGIKTKNRMINVCCDSWNLYPVSITEISSLIQQIKFSSDELKI